MYTAANAETVPTALNAVGAAADTFKAALDAKATVADEVSDANKANYLVTAGAVVDYVAQEISGLDASPTDAGTQGVSVAVVETDGVITGVTTTVTKATLNTTLGTTNVADKTVATSIGATGVDTALATEKAVRDAISDAALVWKNASGQVID